jgi:CheY-like chemotaxis protein
LSQKARILLVDDRAENLIALEAILTSLNQVLVPVHSGEEALKALLTDEFAVILLDVVMPGMDGFDTAAHIKRRAKTRDVPIIFLTAASAEPDHAFRGYAAGAVDYIAKPFDPWVLRAKVAVFVELYEKNRQLHEQAELLRSQLEGAPAIGAGTANGTPDGEDAKQEGAVAEAHGVPEVHGSPGAPRLLNELSGRLAAVEDITAVLAGQAAATENAILAENVKQLEHRVDRLRDALDALHVSG